MSLTFHFQKYTCYATYNHLKQRFCMFALDFECQLKVCKPKTCKNWLKYCILFHMAEDTGGVSCNRMALDPAAVSHSFC